MMKKNNLQKKSWSVFEAILVFIIVVSLKRFLPLSETVLFNNFSKLISPDNPFLGKLFGENLFIALCFVVLIGLFLKYKYALTWDAVGLKPGKTKGWLITGIGQGCLLFTAIIILVAFVSLLFHFEAKEQAVAEVFKTALGWRERLLSLMIVSVLVPFSEELYFRGFLYPALRAKIGGLAAVIVTNLFFGFLHFDLIRFIPITIGGIWLNMLYIKTDTLYTAMVAHSVWNALMILLLFLTQSIVVF